MVDGPEDKAGKCILTIKTGHQRNISNGFELIIQVEIIFQIRLALSLIDLLTCTLKVPQFYPLESRLTFSGFDNSIFTLM